MVHQAGSFLHTATAPVLVGPGRVLLPGWSQQAGYAGVAGPADRSAQAACAHLHVVGRGSPAGAAHSLL